MLVGIYNRLASLLIENKSNVYDGTFETDDP